MTSLISQQNSTRRSHDGYVVLLEMAELFDLGSSSTAEPDAGTALPVSVLSQHTGTYVVGRCRTGWSRSDDAIFVVEKGEPLNSGEPAKARKSFGELDQGR